MAIADDLTTYYENNPWSHLDRNERDVYFPMLLDAYEKTPFFRSLVPVAVDTSQAAWTAKRVTYNIDLGGYEPNTNPAPYGELWTEAMRSDTAQISITMARHTWKEMSQEHERIFTYWRNAGESQRVSQRAGFSKMIRQKFVPSIIRKMDLQALHAHLKTPFANTSTGTRWVDVQATDDFDLGWALQMRGVRAGPRNLGTWGDRRDILCVTTSGSMLAIEEDADFNTQRQYTPEFAKQMLHEGVTERYKRIQFAENDDLILWNCGTITKQVAIKTSAPAGSGGYNWANYTIGQQGSTQFLSVSDFAAADFAVNDVVTIHLVRGDANGHLASLTMSDGSAEEIPQVSGGSQPYYDSGVPYGVNPFDGHTVTRVVKYVDATPGACKIGFEKPIFWDFTTDLVGANGVGAKVAPEGGNFQENAVDLTTVYGYVTKGVNIHASLFVFNPGAVVLGAIQLPVIQDPEPFDDHGIVWRHTANAYYHYQPFRPENIHVIFHSGKYTYDGNFNRNT